MLIVKYIAVHISHYSDISSDYEVLSITILSSQYLEILSSLHSNTHGRGRFGSGPLILVSPQSSVSSFWSSARQPVTGQPVCVVHHFNSTANSSGNNKKNNLCQQ